MMRLALHLIAAGLALAAAPVAAQETSVKLVLKLLKARPTGQVIFDRTSCPACRIDNTPDFSADNPRETVVALIVPRLRQLELRFNAPKGAIRRVIAEGGDVPFVQEGSSLIVQLPPLLSDAITAAEFATHIVEPGMVLRFEHADPARRSGYYATGPFPNVQRQAANVLEFAQREVVRLIGLGEKAETRNLGRIQIMGFDTNTPHGHRDSPPHMHMHLRWPNNTGTQIGHYYIGEDGLLTHNQAGIKGLEGGERRFGRGEAFTTIGPDGRPFYTHRITQEGWLELGSANAPPCLIRPARDGATGFATGATLSCPGNPPVTIDVTDDMALGRLQVRTGSVLETFRYDPDTGALLSPAAVKPPAPSVFVEP